MYEDIALPTLRPCPHEDYATIGAQVVRCWCHLFLARTNQAARIKGEFAMVMKQDFAEQVKAQADVWQSQIKQYQEQLNQGTEQVKVEYEKAIAQMQERADEARKLFEQAQRASETAWEDVYNANQRAFAELQKGWADAISRFGGIKK
jgi:ABC-type uncharacterized transport system auxiliary subunit